MSVPESDLLAVALTRYADACPPTRHTDCPFAVLGPHGRTCRQECRDEVIRLQRPGHSSLSVFAGQLFDARQTLLTENGYVPEAGWHTASLIVRLDEALRFPPRGSDGTYFLLREIDITNALAYLAQRGIDPDWLVRFGLATLLPLRIAVWVGDHYLNRQAGEDDVTEGWLDIARSFIGSNESFDDLGPWLAAAQRTGFGAFIEKWVRQAPLEDLWAWRPSTVDPELIVADDGRAGWIVDRFRRTYLSEWAETSLHHEYRYLQGQTEPPIPTAEMKKRDVAAARLNAEIADRAVRTSRSHAKDVIWQALQFLHEGRRREAAALFDATRIIEPTDASAHNNYGFCLTPDAPDEALEALRRADVDDARILVGSDARKVNGVPTA